MPLIETLIIEVGSSIAKSILKLWLGDVPIASDASSSIVDILKAWTTNRVVQQRAERQFQAIGERVGENLLPLFESDGGDLDEGSREAVARAVAETLSTANITAEILAQHDLEPSRLARYLLSTYASFTHYFNETERLLYQRVISESCEYIVNIASQLPRFNERTFAEVLKREGQLLSTTEQTLQEIRRMREQINPMAGASHFELEYRRAVGRNMDVVQLFGTDVSAASRRYRLSVAYVTLSVEQRINEHKAAREEKDAHSPTTGGFQQSSSRRIVSVDKALAGVNRLLIRGQAGSGKTTLLQWIAVNSASQTFGGSLGDWNDTLPFYIRLRQYAESDLPAPEAFLKVTAPAIADTMPKGWVHATLTSGRAIVLVDGLDEVPELQREEVRTWLKQLMDTYKKARYIATSRPHAIEEGWMDSDGFSDAILQPMDLSDIRAFIDHWHDAIAEELYDEEEKAELPRFAQHLKQEVEDSRSKRNLATSPLLCAMLCALNRERRQQLPSDRIELYEACCQMLIERRDMDRRIQLADYPALALTYRQRRVLLEDLAYWLVKNGWSEVGLQDVDERFARKLVNLQGLPQPVTGSDFRQLCVERSGIIREPVVGKIDFTHRTFQEFLAARAALDEGDIGMLVQSAHNDQWREIVILVAGLASNKVRETLIEELIIRGDKEEKYRYQLHLLAVSCLETSVELGQHVKRKVEMRLGELVPPRDMTDAKALAAAGEMAIPHLLKSKGHPASTIATCVRTLSFIGGEAALDAIEEYAHGASPDIVDELFRAWDSFEQESFAQRVLSPALHGHVTVPEYVTSLSGFQYFIHVTALNLSSCKRISNLKPLADLTQLTSLDVSYCWQITNLRPLANLIQLTSLNLSYSTGIADLRPLASLTKLTSLDLLNCEKIRDLRPLANLIQLASLNLAGCKDINDLRPLASLTKLTSLDLAHCQQIHDISPLINLTQLIRLDLSYCRYVKDLGQLINLSSLKELKLYGIARYIDIPKNIKRVVVGQS
jgi:NACHT N-terminal Helical domain 1/NACHT domain/Leucine Rich repeats (2 copies)